jgi:hypothetical protein
VSNVRVAVQRHVLFALALLILACNPQQPQTFKPEQTLTAPGTPAAAQQTTPCARSVASVSQLVVASEPPPFVPGAGGEDEEHDQGDVPPVPVDPDGELPDLGPAPVAPAPGAQNNPGPEDVATYRSPLSIAERQTLPTAEPNIAVHGERILMTWNKLAALSSDGGRTSQFLYPDNVDKNGNLIDGGFCCDQLAQYDANHQLWLWVLQYDPANGRNRIRLNVALGDDGFDAHTFTAYDFSPQDAGYSSGYIYDQTKLGLSNGYLYLSINVEAPTGGIIGAQVLRISLAQLAAGEDVEPACYAPSTAEGKKLWSAMPVRQAADTMYLGAHDTNTTLAIWRWPDTASAPTYLPVVDYLENGNKVAYPGHYEKGANGDSVRIDYSCPRTGAIGNTDWCSRPANGGGSANDERITTGWLANGRVGFAWDAGQRPPDIKYPFVWAQEMDVTKLDTCALGGCVVDYLSQRFSDSAIQYAAVTPNAAGDLGAVFLFGGGGFDLTCAVGVHDALTPAGHNWDLAAAASSDRSPPETSGDYLGIATDPGSKSWFGGCMTARTGTAPTVVHFMPFGRLLNAAP